LPWGLANFGFIIWLPTLLQQLGLTATASAAYLAATALMALPAVLLTAPLVSRWSSRWTLVGYALGGALSLAALALTAPLRLPLLTFILSGAVLFFILALGGVLAFYAAEVFPTSIRGRRSGIVAGLGKLGGAVGPYFAALWLSDSGLAFYLSLAGLLALAGLLLLLAGVETRGRSLENVC
jgi:putative MFS transporter